MARNDFAGHPAPPRVQGTSNFVFPATGAFSISVADPDAGNPSDPQLTLTADAGRGQQGTITLGSMTGLTNINRNGTSTVSFQATQANSANAFNGLRLSRRRPASNGKITWPSMTWAAPGTSATRRPPGTSTSLAETTRRIRSRRRRPSAACQARRTRCATEEGKAKLFIRIIFSDGRPAQDIESPFQKTSGFTNILVISGDDDSVLVSAQEEDKKTVTASL